MNNEIEQAFIRLENKIDKIFGQLDEIRRDFSKDFNAMNEKVIKSKTEIEHLEKDVDNYKNSIAAKFDNIWTQFRVCEVKQQKEMERYSRSSIISIKLWVAAAGISALASVVLFLLSKIL